MKIKNTKAPLLIRVVFLYLALSPILFVGWFSNQIISDSYRPVENTVTMNLNYVEKISGQPSRLIVERLGLDLPINPGLYDVNNDSWTLSNGVAYYATITDLPNNKRGSTFLYGHNQDDTLASLGNLQVGDHIVVETENNHRFTYQYEKDEYIMPDQTDILYEHPSRPRVVIAICETFLGITRRIMYFNLVEAV